MGYFYIEYMDYKICIENSPAELYRWEISTPEKEKVNHAYAPTEIGALEDAKAAILVHKHFGSI